MIVEPARPGERDQIQVVRGPSIRPIPVGVPGTGEIRARVVKALGDNVSTDEIAPTGPEYGALRSNVPEAAKTAFIRSDPGFYERALEYGSSIIAGRGELRPGLQQRARRPAPGLPGREGGDRQVLCQNTPDQPDQLRRTAFGFRRGERAGAGGGRDRSW